MSESIGFAESGAPGRRPVRVAVLALIRNRRLLLLCPADSGQAGAELPGDEVGADESPRDALVRSSRERLGIALERSGVEDQFTVLTSGSIEDGNRMVSMTVYTGTTQDDPRAPEGNHLCWATSADADRCAPSAADAVGRIAQLGLID